MADTPVKLHILTDEEDVKIDPLNNKRRCLDIINLLHSIRTIQSIDDFGILKETYYHKELQLLEELMRRIKHLENGKLEI